MACDASPAVHMRGIEPQRVRVGAHDYALYRDGTRFEIIRYGYAPRDTQAEVRRTMLLVVHELTGCIPDVDTGDSGEMRGRLISCPRSGS